MSTKVGDIFVRAGLDQSQYRKGLSSMQSAGVSVAKSIGKKMAVAFSVAGLTKFAKQCTDAGASLNAMGTIIDASLPHMTAQVDAFAKSAGAMFGLSETQAKGFVGKFASMASAMGYTEKQAYNMSTALTGLAGDVASYYHISQDDAYAKLGAVFTGETESLKQLGVVMTQNALDQFALQQGFGKTTAQMTELEKTTLRYQFVLDRLKLTSGDFAKYANTWSGSIATIKLNWSNFMATVGQGLINILLPLLQLIAKISNALTALGSRFLAWTKAIRGIKEPIASAFGKKTQDDLKNVGGGVENVGSNLGGVGKSAKGAKKQVQALKKELLGFDKITKLSGEQGVTNNNTGTSGGGNISAGGVDFSQADSDVASFAERAKNLLDGIKLPPALQTALTDLKTAFSGLFDVLSNAGKWAYDNILVPLGKWTMNELAPVAVETLANAVNLVSNALKLIGTILEPLWEPIIKPFFTFLGGVAVDALKGLNTVLEFLAKLLGNASEGFKNLKTWAEDAVKAVKEKWDALKAGLAEIMPKISLNDLLSTAIETIKTKWTEFKTFLAEIKPKISLNDAISTAIETVKTKWTEFKSNFKDIMPKVGIDDKLTGVVDKIKNAWNNIKKAFLDKKGKPKNIKAKITIGLKNNFTKAWNKVKKVWNSIKSKTATIKLSFSNAITSGWNAIADKVNNARSKSKIVAGLFPQPLPKLAEGAYVKANTPQLAIIGDNKHEGEITAPESKLRAMAQEVANNSGNAEAVRLLSALLVAVNNLDMNVYLDGEAIKNNTVSRINNHTRRTGQLELIV